MGRGDLTNEEWVQLKPHLPKSGQRGGRWEGHRRVINGILFRQRTGVPWRDLPARFGKWK
ncbi:transposase, partial [Streptomyces aureocirculatus]|uniref:transposase n=1 Tax=Streptomyces aureocirculatus TaxID=67275 RepID=UPI0012FE887F